MKLSDKLARKAAGETDAEDEAGEAKGAGKATAGKPSAAKKAPARKKTTAGKKAAAQPDRRASRRAADRAKGPGVVETPAYTGPDRRTGGDAEAKHPARRASDDHWRGAKRRVHDAVLEELVPRLRQPDPPKGTELEAEVTAIVDRLLREEDIKVSPAERRNFVAEVVSETLGYGPLDDLLRDPDVNEVMCNAFNEIWVERKGRIERTKLEFADHDQYRRVIDKIVSAVGRRVDESSPMVDARLPDGSRVNAIIPPIAVHGAVLTIRRFAEDPFTVQDLIGFGSLSDDAAVVLEACVRGRLNVLVSGGTGTGKTTLLNVLSSFIPDGERIITIEDAAELQLQQPHVITLEARPANAEGSGQVTIRDLVRNSLRMRPDRIVVGECRGAEALDMLQAMNTGHEGSLATIHANSPREALSRLEMLVLMSGMDLPEKAIREQIAAAIDVVIQIRRFPDGSRKIVSIEEVHGMEDRTIVTQEVFRYEPTRDAQGRYVGAAEAAGLRPKFLEVLKERGVEVPAAVLRPPGGRVTPVAARKKPTTKKAGK